MSNSTGFYEAKNMVRRTVIIADDTLVSLKKYSKKYKITQGELLDVLLTQVDLDTFQKLFEAKFAERAAEKSAAKSIKSGLVKQLKNLKPEQLAAIEAIIEGKQP